MTMSYEDEIEYQSELMQVGNPPTYLLLAEGLHRAEGLQKQDAGRLAAELQPLALRVREDRQWLTLFRWHYINRKVRRKGEPATDASALCEAYFPFLKEYLFCSIDDLSAYVRAAKS